MMLKVVLALALVAVGQANIIKRSDDENECYRCSSYNALGQGFIESDDNPPMCGHYKECWKSKDSDQIQSIDRWCPPGTWVNPDEIHLGAPCTNTECNDTICDDCGIPTASTPESYGCPYQQCDGAAENFCMWNGAELVQVGTCGVGGYFNDTDDICTCTNMTVDCTCKVSIPLHVDTDSHGCNGGWVGQLGMPAMATIEDGCGQFDGYESALSNGDHLGTFVIDGAFAGDWVFKLKWTASVTFPSLPADGGTWGIVTYGDCAGGASFGLRLVNEAGQGKIYADLELKHSPTSLISYSVSCDVNAATQYGISALWDNSLQKFKIHCVDDATHASCVTSPQTCPGEDDEITVPEGSASPRGCGFLIGFTGSDDQSEFFEGQICDVSVDIMSDYHNPHPCV